MHGFIKFIIERGIVGIKGGFGMFTLTKNDTTIDVVHDVIEFI